MFQAAFLRDLANAGGGAFCYAADPATLARRLSEQLQLARAVAATEGRVELTLQPGTNLLQAARLVPEFGPLDMPRGAGQWSIPVGPLSSPRAVVMLELASVAPPMAHRRPLSPAPLLWVPVIIWLAALLCLPVSSGGQGAPRWNIEYRKGRRALEQQSHKQATGHFARAWADARRLGKKKRMASIAAWAARTALKQGTKKTFVTWAGRAGNRLKAPERRALVQIRRAAAVARTRGAGPPVQDAPDRGPPDRA